jgi:very-short-patch-repair endonuclease
MPQNIIIPYKPGLKEIARELRKNPTLGEKVLWREIRRSQLGCEFHRQVPIDEFVVDFYCHELMLAIEIDGVTHDISEVKVKDAKRQARLENLGVNFLRFRDEEVVNYIDRVVNEIQSWIEKKVTSP